MSHKDNGHGKFKVQPVGTVAADLRRLHEELMQQGEGGAFINALRQVNRRLQTDPRAFGEALYRLPALKLVVHLGIVSPLVVTYGIHDEIPLVFVHVVRSLSKPKK